MRLSCVFQLVVRLSLTPPLCRSLLLCVQVALTLTTSMGSTFSALLPVTPSIQSINYPTAARNCTWVRGLMSEK